MAGGHGDVMREISKVPGARMAESLNQGNGCRLSAMTCTSRPLLALSR